jgi:hypothetical protein
MSQIEDMSKAEDNKFDIHIPTELAHSFSEKFTKAQLA